MNDDHANHRQGEIGPKARPTTIGWNEIRAALEKIELLQNNGMSDASLVLVERNEHSSVKVTLRSIRELEEYLESRKRNGNG